MAITPSDVVELYDVIQGGGVIVFIEFQFTDPVLLLGVPVYHLTDGLGNLHRCRSASPHISDPDEAENYVHLRFEGVPKFGPYAVIVPVDDPAITDVGTGEFVAAGTYGAPK